MRHVDDGAEWDRWVLSLPNPHVLQSHDWGELKARWGWSVARFAWEADEAGGGPAAAQVLVRRVGGLPLSIGYVPKGPLVADPLVPAAWARVLADLEAWTRERGLALLKIDPDVPASAAPVANLWRGRGWKPSDEQIQFPNTMTSDLAGGEAAVLAAMKPKSRYNLRLAERRGVTVRHGGPADLEVFHALYAETGARGGFAVRSWPYYRDAWTTFLESGRATLVLAERRGVPLAGVLPVAFGPTAWFLYGASGAAGREHMPAYLAQWESLCWAIARGCRTYDWWGGPTRLDASDPLWGVYRFKEGFGAVWRPQIGAWDYAARPARAAAYRALARARRVWLARRPADAHTAENGPTTPLDPQHQVDSAPS